MANQLRVNWPADRLCNSCFYTAMRTRGICPSVGTTACYPAGSTTRILDRYACHAPASPEYRCAICHTEGQLYRGGQCAAARFATTSLL